MATLYKILILYVGLVLSTNLWAQSRLPGYEQRCELDSIYTEIGKVLGLNDDAYTAKTAKGKWLSGEAKLLLQGGGVYISQDLICDENWALWEAQTYFIALECLLI